MPMGLINQHEGNYTRACECRWVSQTIPRVIALALVNVNRSQLNSTLLNSTQLNSTQLNSSQLNSTQLNSTQLNSTQLSSTQLNSTKLNETCCCLYSPALSFGTPPPQPLPSQLGGKRLGRRGSERESWAIQAATCLVKFS